MKSKKAKRAVDPLIVRAHESEAAGNLERDMLAVFRDLPASYQRKALLAALKLQTFVKAEQAVCIELCCDDAEVSR